MIVYHGSYVEIKQIDLSKCEPIVEKLFTDFGFNEKTATEIFFSSNIFSKLADTSSQLFQKPWQEIYEMLKTELQK